MTSTPNPTPSPRTTDPDGRDYVMALGYLQAPVVVVDATTHWAGFRDGRIAEVAAQLSAQAV